MCPHKPEYETRIQSGFAKAGYCWCRKYKNRKMIQIFTLPARHRKHLISIKYVLPSYCFDIALDLFCCNTKFSFHVIIWQAALECWWKTSLVFSVVLLFWKHISEADYSLLTALLFPSGIHPFELPETVICQNSMPLVFNKNIIMNHHDSKIVIIKLI